MFKLYLLSRFEIGLFPFLLLSGLFLFSMFIYGEVKRKEIDDWCEYQERLNCRDKLNG